MKFTPPRYDQQFWDAMAIMDAEMSGEAILGAASESDESYEASEALLETLANERNPPFL